MAYDCQDEDWNSGTQVLRRRLNHQAIVPSCLSLAPLVPKDRVSCYIDQELFLHSFRILIFVLIIASFIYFRLLLIFYYFYIL